MNPSIPSVGIPAGLNTSMSVLDRVKMFLPQIEKANADLEKEIIIHGNDQFLIDKDLINPNKKELLITDVEIIPLVEKVKEKQDEAEEKDAEEADDLLESNTDDVIEQVIELNFALGDFDETAIAISEESLKEEANLDKNINNEEDLDDNDD